MESPGERLRHARKAAGFDNAADAARERGFHPQNLRDHEAGRRNISADHAAAYGRAFKVSPTWILYGGESPAPKPGELPPVEMTREVPLIGEVRAGYWAEVLDYAPEPEDVIAVSLPEYARAQLFALRVVGPSMNKVYPDGTIVICCPAAEAGVREGDIAVVRRRRGGLVETTLKQVVLEDGKIVLWPRSTDAAHQSPIKLETARDADEGPEVIAVVVGSQSKVTRTGALLAF